MGLIQIFDGSVLKVSAVVSSVYISAIIAGSLTKEANATVNNQALGFATLFFISLLIYLVV
jgi:hypothetical protein